MALALEERATNRDISREVRHSGLVKDQFGSAERLHV